MLSKKDKEILRFIEEHKSITINQCANAIFTGNKWAKDQARKQLRTLYKEGLIQRFQGNKTSEVVYYTMERLGVHDLKLLDCFCEFINLGAKVETFHKKYRIYTTKNKKKYREIDALLEVTYQNTICPIILEIDYSHYTGAIKLKEIYKSNHFQELYGEEVFPLIVIVRPVAENKLVIENDLLILYVDWELKNLKQALE